MSSLSEIRGLSKISKNLSEAHYLHQRLIRNPRVEIGYGHLEDDLKSYEIFDKEINFFL